MRGTKKLTDAKLLAASRALLALSDCSQDDFDALWEVAMERANEAYEGHVPMYEQELIGWAFNPDHLVRLANHFSHAMSDDVPEVAP